VASDGPYPDQTQVDGFDIGLDGWLLGAQPGNDSVFPDALENDVNIDSSPAYIQKWNPVHVEGNARPVSERRVVIVSYYKTTWGDDNFAKPYSVVLDTAKVIGVQDSNPFQFIRSPSTLRVYLDNIRGYTTAEKMIAIQNALITLTLPQGMGDANDLSRRVISKTISNINPREMKFVDFQIASLPTTFGVQEVQVKIQPQPGPTRVVTGQIVVASQPYLQIQQNANLVTAPYVVFATAIFFCGLLTVAQFSFLSEFLPRVFPMHLRGTGGSFATNFGGRMIGTMAATLNTEILAPLFTGTPPLQVAAAAGVIGGSVYFIALVASFFLPKPHEEVERQANAFGRDEVLKEPKSETVD